MCQSFDFSLPNHRGSLCPVPLNVDDMFWFVHLRVFGSSPFQMLGEPMVWVVGVTCIVASVLAEDNVDVIRALFSHCSRNSLVRS